MENEADRFGLRLRELRTAAGVAQPTLAARVGLSVRQISRLETSVQVPTWPTVLALAKALNVSTEAFLVELATDSPSPSRGRPRKTDGASDAQPKASAKPTKKRKGRSGK